MQKKENLSSEFIVIGAGVLGLATAEALLRQGASVIILERGVLGQESSWAGGGILAPLCPWDYPDEVTALALQGAALFGDWAESLYQATGIDPEYQRSGMLVMAPSDIHTARQWSVAHGMQLEERDPDLFLPEIAQVRNPRLLRALRARAEQLGANIIEQCEVKEIVTAESKVTHCVTSHGDFSMGACIVTAGAWSKELLGKSALQAEIKPIRGQMLLFKFDAPPLQYIVLQKDLYIIPRRDGHLLVGSTLEDVGFDKNTTNEAREMLLRRAIALLPALQEMPVIKHWAGLRPGSPGNIPTIGRHPRLENLYINSGHFRYGVTMAPASVEVLLNEMNGVSQMLDVSSYRWT